jgi:hypothetical protein
MNKINKVIAFVFIFGFISATVNASMSEEIYLKKRAALIVKHSHNDKTFDTLRKAMKSEDTLSAEFWRWKIDQYLYGQYTEFQPIYDEYTTGKSFLDMYNIPNDPFIAKEDPAKSKLQVLPEGYFSGNLPGDRAPGWSIYADGKIVIAYEGDLTDPYIASYDIAKDTWYGSYKAGHSTLSKNGRKRDSHGKPALVQDDDGYFHIIFGGHGGERDDGLNPLSIDTAHAGGRFTHVVSDKPNDISSFSVKDDVSPFGSYAEVVKMDNGDIYFFTRTGTHKSPYVYYKLAKGSQTLEPPVMMTWPTPHKANPMLVDMFYVKTFKASPTDILVTSMWHLCNFKEAHTSKHDDRFNAYYMRLDTRDDTFYNVKGEKLTLPITRAIGDQKTLVYDSVADGTIVNDTKGLKLEDGTPAMSYELRFPEPREWKMATFTDGKWTSGLPMPNTASRTLMSAEGKPIDNIIKLEQLTNDGITASAAAIYRDSKKGTVFAIAKSDNETGVIGQDWIVETDHITLSGRGGMQMKLVKDELDKAVGVVVNVSKGNSRRLYLWHDGKLRPN